MLFPLVPDRYFYLAAKVGRVFRICRNEEQQLVTVMLMRWVRKVEEAVKGGFMAAMGIL